MAEKITESASHGWKMFRKIKI